MHREQNLQATGFTTVLSILVCGLTLGNLGLPQQLRAQTGNISKSQDSKSSFCKQSHQLLLFPDPNTKETVIFFCNDQGMATKISRGEIGELYNASKEDKNYRETWAKILEVPAENLLQTIRDLPNSDEFEISLKDKEIANKVAAWRAKSVNLGYTPEILQLKSSDKKTLEKEILQSAIDRCLASKGSISLGETSFSCRCNTNTGKVEFPNTTDFSCDLAQGLVSNLSRGSRLKYGPRSSSPTTSDKK